MMKTTRLPRRGFARPHAHTLRSRLTMEQLEDRSLLSAAGLVDLGSFRIDPSVPYDPNHILVQFRPELATPDSQTILPGSRLGQSFRLVPGLREVTLPAGVSVPAALAAFQASPFVVYAEPNYYGEVEYIPNDPRWSSLYGMQRIQAPAAWDTYMGGTNTIVAVMDTGANLDHDDLYLNIWVNQGEIPPDRYFNFTDVDFDGLITFWDLNDPVNQGEYLITDINGDGKISGSDILAPDDGAGFGGWADGIDADGSGRIDDLVGWDFQSNDRIPDDSFGHGTHVAGTVGAIGDNGVGVVGVNFKTQIMVCRIGPGPGINVTAAVAALDYAVARGVQVSNSSWGGTGVLSSLRSAIIRAQAAGHVFVAAAGNSNTNNDVRPFYPANYSVELDNVISVAATTNVNDNRASFSNYGAGSVQLGAPGLNILSTLRNGGYGNMSGTSMASPHVAGAVAYLFSAFPGIDYQSVINAILAGVDPVASLSGFVSTGGRLNLANSLGILLGGGAPGGGSGGGNFGGFLPGVGGLDEPGFLALSGASGNLALVVQTLAEQATVETVTLTETTTPVTRTTPAVEQLAGDVQQSAPAESVSEDESTPVVERDRIFDEVFANL